MELQKRRADRLIDSPKESARTAKEAIDTARGPDETMGEPKGRDDRS